METVEWCGSRFEAFEAEGAILRADMREKENIMSNFERIIPVLTYQDIPAAHDFLVNAFGFCRDANASGGR